MRHYTTVVHHDEDSAYGLTFPELTCFGVDEAEALRYGALALQEAVAARMAEFSHLPRPVRR